MTPGRRWARILALAVTLFILPVAIILPFGDDLFSLARNLGERSAPAAFFTVVSLLAIDSIAIIPHGLVGALAGAALDLPLAALATWIGIMLASCIAYAIGRFAGRPIAKRLLGKDDLSAAEKRASGVSALVLFATRPVPVVGEIILIAAGIARYPFRRFFVAIGAANILLALAYTGLGGLMGESDPERLMLIATLGIPALGVGLYGLSRIFR